jgi:transcription antitermination protein NusB
MQNIFAMHLSQSDNLDKEKKFLNYSIESIHELYLTMLSLLIEIQKREIDFLDKSSKKHLSTPQERNPNKKFVNNSVFKILLETKNLSKALEDKKIKPWDLHDDYVYILLSEIKNSSWYEKYMHNEVNDFEEDKVFIMNIFTEIIAPNEKLYEFIEDTKLTWTDDISLINTQIIKQLEQLKPTALQEGFKVSKLYKDAEDQEFSLDLFAKTVLNEAEFAKEFADKTPNWDTERIAEMDTIMLKMAICEFLKFPSIPTKVTINEYLEIAKEYSTPKSSIFINGILDNLVKEFQAKNKLNKIGRGLM